MSCFEQCCREPEVETAPNQTIVAQTSTWPAECPDEAADSAVNGLGTVCLSVSGSFSEVKGNVRKDSADSDYTSEISERIRTTDLKILRGITLRDSLRSRGSLWRKNPMYLVGFLTQTA